MKYAFTLLFSLLYAGSQAQESISTLPALTGGSVINGIIFQLGANTALTIDTVYVPLTGPLNYTSKMNLWYTPNRITQANVSPPQWTQLLQEVEVLVLNTHPQPAHGPRTGALVIPGGISMMAGDTISLCVARPTGSLGNIIYSPDTSSNPQPFIVSDANLSLLTGASFGFAGTLPILNITNTRYNGGVAYRLPRPRDMRTTTILSPITIAEGNNFMSIRVQNAGTDTIFSFDAGYSFDNQAAVMQLNVQPNPPLAPNDWMDLSFNTPWNVGIVANHHIKSWVNNVNNLGNDLFSANDTLQKSFCKPYEGSFTVGDSLSDYLSLHDAFNDFNQCGISGPIELLLKNGDYQGPFYVPDFPANQRNYLIQIRSASENAQDVRFLNNGPNTFDRSHLVISTQHPVSIRDISFLKTQNTLLAEQACISFVHSQTRGVVRSCRFNDETLSNANTNLGIWHRGSYSIFESNVFNGFYHAIFLQGDEYPMTQQQNAVTKNEINNYRYRAIYALNQYNVLISHNLIHQYAGNNAAGAAIHAQNLFRGQISENQISGEIGNFAFFLNNLNADTINPLLNPNRIFNNIINARHASRLQSNTNQLIYLVMNRQTAVSYNPADAIEITHNTIRYEHNPNANFIGNAALFLISSASTASDTDVYSLLLANNIFDIRPSSGNIPSNFRMLQANNQVLLGVMTSSHNNYLFRGSNTPPMFRGGMPLANYNSVSDWNQATGQEVLSTTFDPIFLTPEILVPTSVALNNRGVSVSFVQTDIIGQARDSLTPDFGAFEFDEAYFSVINHQPLGDTLPSAGRYVYATIADTAGVLEMGAQRLFYRKKGSVNWEMDSLPIVNGTVHQFFLDYSLLGPAQAGDTLEYYLAVRNNSGTVTTFPFGGIGLRPPQRIPPSQLISFRLLPVMGGTYLVGTNQPNTDFTTLTDAFHALNTRLIISPVTLLLTDSVYGPNETFPLQLHALQRYTDSVQVAIRPYHLQNQVVIRGHAANGSAILILDGLKHFELNGAHINDSVARIRLVDNGQNSNTSVIRLDALPSKHVHNIKLINLEIEATHQNTIQTGIQATLPSGPAGTYHHPALADIQIKNIRFQKLSHGISLSAAQRGGRRISIENCVFGDSLEVSKQIRRIGISLTGTTHSLIKRNIITNMRDSTSATLSGIVVLQNSHYTRIEANRIFKIHNKSYAPTPVGTGGVEGIRMNSDSIMAINNVIYDLHINNRGLTSFIGAIGIRIGFGRGLAVHHNSIYLSGHFEAFSGENNGVILAAVQINSNIISAQITNNMFALACSASHPSYFNAIWHSGTSYAPLCITDHNAYLLTNTYMHTAVRTNSQSAAQVFSNIGDWRTAMGNHLDANSYPQQRKVAPPNFGTGIPVPAPGTITGMESAGMDLFSNNVVPTDYFNQTRPAGSGTAPDMGAFEFDGIAATEPYPPIIDSVIITPSGSQCTTTPRIVRAYVRDNPGGIGIDSVWLRRSINSQNSPIIGLQLVSGNAQAGVYETTLPGSFNFQTIDGDLFARDSLTNLVVEQDVFRYIDDYISYSGGNDALINPGDTVQLTGVSARQQTTQILAYANPIAQLATAGVMFNLVNLKEPSRVKAVYLLPAAPGNQNVRVYYRAGGKNGFETDSSAWHLEGSYTINPSSNQQPFLLTLNGISIRAGETMGIYLQYVARYGENNSNPQNVDVRIENNEIMQTAWARCCPPVPFSGEIIYERDYNFSWKDLAGNLLSDSLGLVVSPNQTTAYQFEVNDGFCSRIDTVHVVLRNDIRYDIGVSRIRFMPDQFPTHNNPVSVEATFKNYGQLTATNFDACYAVNGVEINCNVINTSLAPGDSLVSIFSQSFTLTTTIGSSSLNLCSYTRAVNPTDFNPSNDTACNLYLFGNVNEQNQIGIIHYPNPTSHTLNIEWNQALKAELVVHNTVGQIVHRQQINSEGADKLELHCSQWATGMYTYSLLPTHAQQSIVRKRFIVQH
ncbi:MAG: T9SS type A sorting domain-containing protein [Bacteroidia bacterium]